MNMESTEKPAKIQRLQQLEQIVFNLNKDNLNISVQNTMIILEKYFVYSYNYIICSLIKHAFASMREEYEIYFIYLQAIQEKEKEKEYTDLKLFKMFKQSLLQEKSQESYYLLDKMIEKKLVGLNIINSLQSIYFSHYKFDSRNKTDNNPFSSIFLKNYEELSNNNYELHKKYVKEGHNPSEIARIIRNDEIEKLQEMSSQNNFDFNQTIEPSLYERCSLVNTKGVKLIDYAAYFSSIKCFKYLLLNKSINDNTFKFAVAGGNLEIIHLCEQNHISLKESFEIAIKFHRNDVFRYIYENNFEETSLTQFDLNKLGEVCINYDNFEILDFLYGEGMKTNLEMINKSARVGNFFLVNYYLENYPIPFNFLKLASKSRNLDLINLILEYQRSNNCICLFCSMFI